MLKDSSFCVCKTSAALPGTVSKCRPRQPPRIILSSSNSCTDPDIRALTLCAGELAMSYANAVFIRGRFIPTARSHEYDSPIIRSMLYAALQSLRNRTECLLLMKMPPTTCWCIFPVHLDHRCSFFAKISSKSRHSGLVYHV